MVEARGVEPLSKEAEIQFSTSVAFDERFLLKGLHKGRLTPGVASCYIAAAKLKQLTFTAIAASVTLPAVSGD